MPRRRRRQEPPPERLPAPEPGEPQVIYEPDLKRQVAALRLVYENALRRRADESKRHSA